MNVNIKSLVKNSKDRFDFAQNLIKEAECKHIAEVGVYKGGFAESILKACELIEKYIMIDPWRNLSDWNKPANKDNDTFEAFYKETMSKTDFAKEKRQVLRGKTTEVIGQVDDNSLDLVYIDGDHTLRGITIDMLNCWSKVKDDGFVVGDDFSPNIWQHSEEFEPTLVFPFGVYFAEAMNRKIYGLPNNQFIIPKGEKGFEFIDLSGGKYGQTEIKDQLNKRFQKNKSLSSKLVKAMPKVHKAYKNLIKK